MDNRWLITVAVLVAGCEGTLGVRLGPGSPTDEELPRLLPTGRDSGPGSGGEDASTFEDPAGLATRVSIASISLLQPVEIPLVRGGVAVAPDLPIFADKTSMVRIGVRFDGATPERVRAVVVMGTSEHSDSRMVSRSSSPDDESSSFWVRVPASSITPASAMQVRLEVPGGDPIDGPGDHPARWPRDGSTTALGAETSAPLHLHLIPMHHTPSGAAGLARIEPAQVERFRRRFAAYYPVSEGQVSIDVRATPLPTAGTAAVVGGTVPFVDEAFDEVWALWLSEQPPRNTLYLGLLEWDADRFPCDGQCGMGLGAGNTLATLSGPYATPLAGVASWADITGGPWMPDYVPLWIDAMGLPPEAAGYVGNDADVAISSFLHEGAHNLTLGHAPCGLSDPDPTYPVADGHIDAWGYDGASDVVRPPAMHFDLMSYCGPPEFVSRFTYRKLDAAIRAIQPDRRSAPPALVAHVPHRIVTIGRSGSASVHEEEIALVPASEPGPGTLSIVACDTEGNVVAETLGRLRAHEDGSSAGVIVPVIDGAARLRWTWEGRRYEVSAGSPHRSGVKRTGRT